MVRLRACGICAAPSSFSIDSIGTQPISHAPCFAAQLRDLTCPSRRGSNDRSRVTIQGSCISVCGCSLWGATRIENYPSGAHRLMCVDGFNNKTRKMERECREEKGIKVQGEEGKNRTFGRGASE